MKTHLFIVKLLTILIVFTFSSCQDDLIDSGYSPDHSSAVVSVHQSSNSNLFFSDKSLSVELLYTGQEKDNIYLSIEDPDMNSISDVNEPFQEGAYIFNSSSDTYHDSGSAVAFAGANKMIYWQDGYEPKPGKYKILVEYIDDIISTPNQPIHFIMNIRKGIHIVDSIEGILKPGEIALMTYFYD